MPKNEPTKKHRFIRGSTTRLNLSYGDWIEVRDRLSWGQQMEMQAAGIDRRQNANDPTAMNIDLVGFSLARMKTYVVAWSFTDPETDEAAPIDDAHLMALDPWTSAEIEKVLTEHIRKQEDAAEVPFVVSGDAPPST